MILKRLIPNKTQFEKRILNWQKNQSQQKKRGMNFSIYQKEEQEDSIQLKTALHMIRNDKKGAIQKPIFQITQSYFREEDFNTNLINQFKEVQHHFNFKCIKIEHHDFYCPTKEQIGVYYDFLLNIFRQYSQTIEEIAITNVDFNIFVQSDNPQRDSQQKILQSIIKQVVSLKGLYIADKLTIDKSTNKLQKSLLFPLNNILKEDIEYFEKLESFYFELKHNLSEKILNKDIPIIQQQLANLCEQFQQVKSLRSFQLQLDSLGLQPQGLYKIIQQVSNLKHITKLGLDLSHNQIKISDQLKNLKCLENLSSNLLDFTFIDDQIYNKKELDIFCQQINALKNLKSILLEGSILKQGFSMQYFDMFKNFSSLNCISIDMSEFKMNKEHFEHAFKSLQSISHTITSVTFILPSHHIMTLNDTQNLLGFLFSTKNNLEELKIVYTNRFDDSGFIHFLKEIPQLYKLKMLGLQLEKKDSTNNCFTVDVRENKDVPNIFELQAFNFSNSGSRNQLGYDKVIMSALLKAQKKQLQSFIYQEPYIYSYYNNRQKDISKEISNFSRENMQSLLNQNQLRVMEFDYAGLEKYINVQQFLENNISQMLKLKVRIKRDNIEVILKQKNIVELNIEINFYSESILSELINNLPLLQVLIITQNVLSLRNEIQDLTGVVQTEYLSELQLIRGLYKNYQFLELIKQRKSQILAIIAYQKLIQPYLIYSPAYSHWDLCLS